AAQRRAAGARQQGHGAADGQRAHRVRASPLRGDAGRRDRQNARDPGQRGEAHDFPGRSQAARIPGALCEVETMQHLNEEQLVLHRYHDDGVDAVAAGQHLDACADCRAQFDTLCHVLALVDDLPVPQRGDDYGTEVWNHLRWRPGRRDRARVWQAFAAAAMIALVFFAGGLWWAKRHTPAPAGGTIATNPPRSPITSPQNTARDHDRILLVVVGDHLDSSERMLLELTNADASRGLDVTAERRRATELVSANRLYRR